MRIVLDSFKRTHFAYYVNMGRFVILLSILALVCFSCTYCDPLEDEYEPMSKKKSDEDDVSLVDGESSLDKNISIRWDDLYWKIICDDDEWRDQFYPIRQELTKCLDLEKIMLPEDKEKEDDKRTRDWSLLWTDGPSNPYCRMSKNWVKCVHLLKDIDCLAPNSKGLEEKKKASSLSKSLGPRLPKYDDPEEWISMHRAYKLTCLIAKSAPNPFALMGMFGG